ncbi:hypothetical protein D5085_01465 [Ectothiorhodospiraceae bacterium BW-2]|nr:hypothetical protein D5085_01465 [Ectothiorhodospiraceae bacterium BW-2]
MTPVRTEQRLDQGEFSFEFDSLTLHFSSWQEGFSVIGQRVDGSEMRLSDLPNKKILWPAVSPETPLGKLQQTIPEPIRKVISPVRNHQYRLIRLTALHPFAAQLCVDNPVLFWLWGVQVAMAAGDLADVIKRDLGQKQHQLLLQLLAGKCAPWVQQRPKSAVKLLKKMTIQAGDQTEINQIMRLLNHPESESMRHQTDIDATTESYLFHCEALNPRWRQHLRGSCRETAVADRTILLKRELGRIGTLWRDAVRMAQELEIEIWERQLYRLKHSEQLIALHDEIVRHYNQKMATLHKQINFPPPPIAGTEKIRPVTNYFELLEEGRVMHHCVGSYSVRVQQGQSYIYQVLSPQRATLELDLTRRKIVIGQMKCRFNAEPTRESYDFVQKWIEEQKTALRTFKRLT